MVQIAEAGEMMRAERRLLMLVAALCLTGLLLVGLAGDHVEGMMLTVWRDATDPALYRLPRWLLIYVEDLTALGGLPVTLTVALLAALLLRLLERPVDAALMLVSAGGGLLLGMGLKLAFVRPRPDLVPHAVEVLTSSFPSSHATMSTVTYLSLALIVADRVSRPAVKTYLLALGCGLPLAIGLSRVVLGVHWPSDVLGGWAFGVAWILLCRSVAFRFQPAH
ncbi:phosphatase PAP2 family protein [Niveispirillum sp. BGYR6]|uniref:phosphatase PAP2 family protein n=1 Tax=Niveispirillum sp. BGYR6 TaxID=2971249 RepID=UPI0022B98B9B|nr:phosphatase PAP2 family protein [Niveispirillum sp. BGYR6]MDG5493495.1 phosphatase PAP2 family protein [Niveispirillum sp. BGYR6]